MRLGDVGGKIEANPRDITILARISPIDTLYSDSDTLVTVKKNIK